jgi:protein-S-isoprenylcysteine O-methyltransferase Ste14
LTAGLDKRFAWSSQIPLMWVVIGAVIYLAGFTLTIWAMAANRFFSAVVRIQSERGHTVQTGGPYRVVRHPGYLGIIIYLCGLPVFLESFWSYIPAIIIILLTTLRTALEDGTLKKELVGYTEYAGRVRFRLVPGVW